MTDTDIMALAFEYRHAIDDRGTKYRALREAIDRLNDDNASLREQNTMLDQKLAELDQRLDDARSECSALKVNEQNLTERLAAGEPILYIHPDTFAMASAHVGAWKPGHDRDGYIPLYTTPQPAAERVQRKPLTDDRVREIALDYSLPYSSGEFARAIERAHGIGSKP